MSQRRGAKLSGNHRDGADAANQVSNGDMTNRTLAAWCSVAYVYVFATPGVFAQCGSGYVGLEQVLPQGAVAIVFSGRAASVGRSGSTETVVFDVDRAWKGPVKQQTTI